MKFLRTYQKTGGWGVLDKMHSPSSIFPLFFRMFTRPAMGRLFLFISLLGLVFACTSCQAGPQTDQINSEEDLPTRTSIPSAIQPNQNTPQAEVPQLLASASFTEAPFATSEPPLELTFPTPGPEPISLWRPPLYPVPWALNPFDHFYFVRPIAADEVNWPLANYRYGGIFFGTDIVHTGVDIPAPRYTPVFAAGPGVVSWAGYGLYAGSSNPNDPYGLAVTILHDFSYQGRKLYTVYAHLDRIDVVTGQQVEPGTPLGIVGMTGKTTGPHLHFEVRVGENSFYNSRNPELWLAPPQGWGVLSGFLRNTNGSNLTEQVILVTSLDTGQKWNVISYGRVAVNPDDYYHENLVLSDLPAGNYEISIDYNENAYRTNILIRAGAISYFTFQGEHGYQFSPPALPGLDEWQDQMGLTE
jgi:murein DD-endopeptidase MepM/ murein hydrolase activator NlpD